MVLDRQGSQEDMEHPKAISKDLQGHLPLTSYMVVNNQANNKDTVLHKLSMVNNHLLVNMVNNHLLVSTVHRKDNLVSRLEPNMEPLRWVKPHKVTVVDLLHMVSNQLDISNRWEVMVNQVNKDLHQVSVPKSGAVFSYAVPRYIMENNVLLSKYNIYNSM